VNWRRLRWSLAIIAVDSAMYRAKTLGRDRVVVAGGLEDSPRGVSIG